jgi:hypothetical protein
MRTIYTFLLLLSCVFVNAQPAVPASNLRFSNIEGAGFQISFDAGNGIMRIIVVKEGSPVSGVPENGKEYNASSNFGTAGTEFAAAGEYVIARTNWTTVPVNSLKPGTTYYIAIFEYNGTGTGAQYLMVPLTGSQSTAVAPGIQASGVTFTEITGNSLRMNWVNGNGNGRVVLARKGAAVNAEPTELTPYFPYTAINGDNYTVYNGSGASAFVPGLYPNTTYHFAVFEYNGSNTPVYLKPASTWSVTTNAGPTKPTQIIGFTGIEGDRMNVGATIGNGAKRLLIARKGAPVTAVPVNGTAYNANTFFGSGQEIAPGEYVIANSSAQNVIVTNLEPNTTYYFRYFEFDEDDNKSTYYLTASPLDGSASTAAPPAGISTSLSVINITGSSATVAYTPGPGNFRLAVVKEGSAVNAVPQDLTYYTTGTEIGAGTGNYSVASGTNGARFDVFGLRPGYTYHVAVFEFNGTYYPVYNKTPATISFSIPHEPTQAATAFSQWSKEGDRMEVSWTNGNGTRRVVIAKKGSAVTYKPVDGTAYTANNSFGQGTKVATGEYVVYDGTSNNFTPVNLEIGADYFFAVYEYSVSAAGVQDYLTSTYLTGNAATITRPTLPVSSMSVSGIQSSQATINYTGGNGAGRIFVIKANSEVDAVPQDLTAYGSYGHTFGSVQFVSAGNYIVNNTAANSPFTVSGLSPNTTYYVTAFEYNGLGQPAYLIPGSKLAFTTGDVPGAATPTTAADNPVFAGVEGNAFAFTWTNGDGANRIVVMREGSSVSVNPASGTAYTANAAFGSGTDLGGGQYVVYNGSGNTVSVTNLLPATMYYFTVFEYNGTGGLIRYLTGSTLKANNATLSAPVTPGSNAVASVSGTSITLGWTNGSGNGRMVVMKKGSAVLSSPADLSVYPANAAFASGAQIGVDEYVVYSGGGNSVVVTGLTSGEVYYYRIFEYNGSAAPVYNVAATVSGSVAAGTLPVTWINFTAAERNGEILLSWATSAEINSDHFIVERSKEGAGFQEVGRVKAAGNSAGDQHYTYTDRVTGNGTLYYRLKQVDRDGLYSYSKIVSFQLNDNSAAVKLQPNPVQNMFRILLPVDMQNATLMIYNAAGVMVQRQIIGATQTVNVQHLPAGLYYVTLQQGEVRYALKMIKQ